MKQIVCLMAFLFMTNCQPHPVDPIKVMTFNIRYGLADDGLNSWKYRKMNVARIIRYHQAEIIGFQEAMGFQLAFLDSAFDHFTWIGAARDDGKRKGEYTAVFYDSTRFRILKQSTFWLSETPDKPGRGWDAAYNRTVTYAKFMDLKSHKTFFFFNTHLDNEGKTARLESTRLIRRKISEISRGRNTILTGDFNCRPVDPPYRYLTAPVGEDSPLLFDTKNLSESGHYGPAGTFTGFDLTAAPSRPIDFIFVGRGIIVKKHATLSDSFDGYLPSDHYPVLTELLLEGE